MRRTTTHGLAAFGLVVVVLAAHWPALSLELIGDDYQWVLHAHKATVHPALLFADLDTFFRPANTWSLVVDRALWGRLARGYHLSNLLLHAAAALALMLVSRRLGLKTSASFALAVVWGTAPFAEEPAHQVAIRFENLLLLGWLGLFLAWPLSGQGLGQWRRAGLVAALALALFSKETWVVTPALVLAAEWALRGVTVRRALRTAALVAVPVVVYVVAYFLAFPGTKGYYHWSPAPLAKVPHTLAAFFYLEELVPLRFPVGWRGGAALIAVIALAIVVVRRRNAVGVVGLGLLAPPLLPILFVPYMPTRYTAIPYAGFLLLMAGAVTVWSSSLPQRQRRLVWLAVGLLAALVLVAGVATVRADLRDLGRVSAAHARLIAEARAVAPGFPLGVPVVHVRVERDAPLAALAASPEGIFKLLFPRHQDPYGLIDVAALFDWVMPDHHVLVRSLVEGDPSAFRPAAVLEHRRGGFHWVASSTPAVKVLALARAGGYYAKAVIAERPR